MRNRILEFCHSPVRLSVRNAQLVIHRAEVAEVTMPVRDIAVIVAAQPALSYSQAVLSELLDNGGVFIVCNQKRLPTGMLLPLEAHGTQTAHFHSQLKLGVARQKQLWKSVVQSRIAMQAMLLVTETGTDFGLTKLIRKVRTGDVTNVEATAASRYWKALFGSTFRRDRGHEGINGLLNYGYAVLRGIVARSLCAAGLHPTLGIHHHNQYNAWCLADDLMEPYRSVIDRTVYRELPQAAEQDSIKGPARQSVLQALLGHVDIGDEVRSIFDAVNRSAQSLKAAICRGKGELIFPEGFADVSTIDTDIGVQCHVVDGDV
jgi:CRISPR-associated protein Cas1